MRMDAQERNPIPGGKKDALLIKFVPFAEPLELALAEAQEL